MNIKDIVNRDLVNLANCEQEPIHIPGSIQPHGCLLAYDPQGYIIEFASGNTQEYLSLGYAELLGKRLEDIFDADTAARILAFSDNLPTTSLLRLNLGGQELFLNAHKSGALCILEIEPLPTGEEGYPDVFNQTRQFLSYMEHSITLRELCQKVADRTRHITGYDRVMIYRFDEEYNGEVFAESLREDLEPFFGLHYPHTDIPVQARELYLRSMLRLIVDTGYEAVPLYTLDRGDARTLDLSLSFLRSISPIHIQYLQNMGVGATLTISIVHKHRLWGLIACHHYSPKNLSPDLRIAAQLQGHFITSQIDMRMATEEYDVSLRSAEAVEGTQTIMKAAESFGELADSPLLLNICNASGVAILFEGSLFTGGVTPGEAEIRRIVGELSATYANAGIHTAHLSALLPFAQSISDSAAGLIYHPLSSLNDDCIVWFRQETVQEVHWGGDPNKAIIRDERGLHPRKSFELWKEEVKNKSKPWLKPELNAAATFAYLLQKHMAVLLITAKEERARKLTETLKASNEELENLNWISTHDLQEPLRKIQMMASRLLQQEDAVFSDKSKDLIARINSSAGRMQTLLRDILGYSKLRYTQERFQEQDLNAIVRQVVSDLEDQVADSSASIRIGELPSIKGVSFLLSQLFFNLLGNALKFSDAVRPQHITVIAMDQEAKDGVLCHHIRVSDTGIGFDSKYSSSIFKIFSRLNNQSEYEGSGIGLALCRKIMEMHQGYITAKGVPGEGATFDLFFPSA